MFNNLNCFIFGHIPEFHLTETEFTFHQVWCSRCKTPLGLPQLKPNPDIPPPNSSPEQILAWKLFCEKTMNEIRND